MNVLKSVIISTVVSVYLVFCLDDEKVSVTFVIDDTASMEDEIDQVMNSANVIFDTVMNSEKSQVENFVLVTFKDPNTTVRVKTKDRYIFKNALSSITVGAPGNFDCPEYAMSGIKEALQKSLPGSYLFVFTDASAKDYIIYEEVENMALNLRSQVVFMLTGMCGTSEDTDYQVYHKLAKATGGEVFHIEKQEINEILGYVRYMIEAPSSVMASKSFSKGEVKRLNITVDAMIKDLVLIVKGDISTLIVTGLDGNKPPHEVVVDTNNLSILKFPDVKPGVYTIEVDSKSEILVKVVARSEVQFNFGFSTFVPSTFNDVTSRPVPDTKSYISVKVTEGDLEMRTVKLFDLDEKQIDETPLNVLDLNQKLYITNLTELPNTQFRIAVTGFDPVSGTIITRVATVPVAPQQGPSPETAKKSPIVTIDKDIVNVSYDDSLQFICKVSGFPKPDINWVDKDEIILAANVSVVELPYNYISFLNIKHAKANNTYHCKANNDLGEDSKPITVEVKRYFAILQQPKDTVIEYNKQGELYCKVESYPESEITWYKDGNILPSHNSTIELKDNNTVLKINNMQTDDVGIYSCEVGHEDGRQSLQANVSITGTEPPRIDKNTTLVHVRQKSDVVINCKLLEGLPLPSIVWNKINLLDEETEITDAKDKENITLRDVQLIDKGLITCEAKNAIAQDKHEIKLIVDYAPSFKSALKYAQFKKGENISLSCDADAEPKPDVVWYKNGKDLVSKEKIIYENYTLKIASATVDDIGNYTCIVNNSMGTKEKNISVDVVEPPRIDKNTTLVHVRQKSDVVINCKLLEGLPLPSIVWNKINLLDEETEITDAKDKENITLRDVQLIDKGLITCEAKNALAQDKHEIKLIVDYAPSFKSALKYAQFKKGENISLSCDADGEPKPDVVWYKNGKDLVSEEKIIYENYTLKIASATVDDIGNYTCIVNNSMGTKEKNISVDVVAPAKITPPKNNTLKLLVGSELQLPCQAEGLPTPHIYWTYHSCNSSDSKVIMHRPGNDSNFSLMNRIQIHEEGCYTCFASNNGGQDNVTYEVHVLAPPSIVNTYKEKLFVAVEGDLALRINCKATGNPKPNIRWLKDGFNVPLGGWYDIDTYGTLIINNIDESASGDYVCEAQNYMGPDRKMYQVEVRKNPPVRSPVAKVSIKYGSTSKIECKVPHKLTDKLRWYKHEKLIKEGELTIKNAKPSDSGIYTCRVSDFFKSRSTSVNLSVE